MDPTFKDYFSAASADYARYRPRYPLALAEALAGLPARPGVAWDVGCGSGQLSTVLAEAFEVVIATDPSASQLAEGRPHPRVSYRVAPAEASGLDDGVVDLVVAAQAAHWFDIPAFYAEARRVARPGAAIALVTYSLFRFDDPAVEAVVDRYYREIVGPYWPPERRHVEAGYMTLDFPFAPLAVAPLAVERRLGLEGVVANWRTWSATRRLLDAGGQAAFEAACAELARAWPGGDRAEVGVRWPITVRAGRLRD
ncbi:MAG: class I SAM-dependent methyltransferase [Myxococcales bacterium]|nr:class I SAM-dependent methyltransferase [Myxococcales bacterium]MCB9733952.1 class I SAM-dependent methyltransferase [Deltaproteobacteria bacterium]